MIHSLFFVDGIRHVAALLIAELILVMPSMERRKYFWQRLLCGCLGAIVLSSLYILLYMFAGEYIYDISSFWYFFIALYCGGVIAFSFKIRTTRLLWSMTAAYAISHLVYIIVYELFYIDAFRMGYDFFYTLILYVLVGALLYTGFYFMFRKNFLYLVDFNYKERWQGVVLFAGIYVVFFIATILNQHNVQVSEEYYLSAISDLVNCLFALFAISMILYVARVQKEKQTAESLLLAEKTQYEMFKNSVDYINVKCHDLKKELEHMNRCGITDTERLDEVASNLAIYDAFAKTGNEYLDIILTEKNLACLAHDITFTYMADAERLKTMRRGDIYTLFSNALDNAIECEKGIENKDERFIRLYVHPIGEMLHVHIENYFKGSLQFKDGLPVTSKEDKTMHGFGVMSMRRTARKYGGELIVKTENGVFSVDIGLKL